MKPLNPHNFSTHYNIFEIEDDEAMGMIASHFPDGPNEMNLIFFSTSGVHGSYTSIEEAELFIGCDDEDEDAEKYVTFVIFQPRVMCLKYGNVRIESTEQAQYLKDLREKSWKEAALIGLPRRPLMARRSDG